MEERLIKEVSTLYTTKRELDLKQYARRRASEDDYATLVRESTVIYDESADKVAVVYLELDDDTTDVVQAIQRIRYDRDTRTSGMATQSKIFGYMPRRTIRRDYCHEAALSREDHEAHATVMSYAEKVSTHYQCYEPELYAAHQREVEKVLPDYKIGSSVFTSGIINKNNPLPYHHDAGNFKNVWSNMLVFKHHTHGGYLSVPEYDVGFELKDNSLLMFDGQNILHGVTPITNYGKDAYRYSVVFYSLQNMWKCLSPEEEIKRYRKVRSEREYKRLKNDREKRAQT